MKPMTMFALLAALTPGAFVAAQAAAPQEAYVTPEYIRRLPTLPPGRDVGNALRLTLAQAIETGIRRNLALDLEREQLAQTETLRSAALSQYEPVVGAFVQRQSARSPPTTRQEGVANEVLESRNTTFGLTLGAQAPTGTAVRLGLTSGISDSMLGTAVLPEVSRTGFSITASQPLLRGFSLSGRVQMAPLLRARFATEIELEQTRLRAMVTVNATENAYWNLVERIKSYEVTAGALQLAERQLDLTRRQIAAGTQPESQLISAEATLAQRQLALVQSEMQIDTASDVLRALMNLPAPEWERPLLPIDTPSFLPVDVAVDSALERAKAARPELKQVQINLKQVALDLELARNARLPLLNVSGGYSTVGQDPSLGTSFEQALRARGHGWTVGADLSWAPLGVGARAEIRRLQSAMRQNAIGRDQVLLDIRGQIRDAVRGLQTAARALHAAARSRELAERNLDVDQRRFLAGLTDNFVIAQRQAEVATARQAELGALIQHERAASDLQLAMGDLLEARNVQFSLRRSG